MPHSLKKYAGFLAGLYMASLPVSVMASEKNTSRNDFANAGSAVTSNLSYFKTTSTLLLEKTVNTLWPAQARINPFLTETFQGLTTLRVFETKTAGNGKVLKTTVEISDTQKNTLRCELLEPDQRQKGTVSLSWESALGARSYHQLSDGKMSVFVNGRVSKVPHDGRPDFFGNALAFSRELIEEARLQNKSDANSKMLYAKDMASASHERFPMGPLMRKHFDGPIKVRVDSVYDKTESLEVFFYRLSIMDDNGHAVFAEYRTGDDTRKGFMSITDKTPLGSTNFVYMNGLLKIRKNPHDEDAVFVKYNGDNKQFNNLYAMSRFYFDKALSAEGPKPPCRIGGLHRCDAHP